MERELKLGDKRIVIQDPNGALAHTIDARSGRPPPDTSRTQASEAATLPPQGFPDTSDPLGVAHAEGQLYGAIYQGKVGPATFVVSGLLSLLGVLCAVAVISEQAWSAPLRAVAGTLVVLTDAWIFWVVFRRMRERRLKNARSS
ncbi:hypothetical protein [Luteibacter sp. 9135]|uniref:hypothetical protein n=1 Tax=Luteibacter sp. 9135 TaxID=1500893 RepID=UPI000560AC6D|nr:hypothetical protein [Luteibacter sp. 9135]